MFQKFQALVTSMAWKVILASGKNPCFEIINEINNCWKRENNMKIVVCMTKEVFTPNSKLVGSTT